MEVKMEIYEYVREMMKNGGVTANEIAERFHVKRNVASHYLNRLVEDGRVIKSSGRPVRFCVAEMQTEGDGEKGAVKQDAPSRVFSQFIGYDGTIKNEIEKCKAAVSYPTNGLPVILCGASGVGKSYLAFLIHEYAAEMRIIPKDAPFVVLNCADYANNSELLSSVLFGYVKGAFTGANEDKPGLLDEADGGYLFLDEVHNLSPENQEKLFIFIDSQRFRRLGDSKTWQTAKVRLLFATTEDIESKLLATFRRRIPLEIRIPDFLERSYSERFALVSRFFQNEAEILKRDLKVEQEVFRHLLNLKAEGNIGAVKSEVKVRCAEAYSLQKNGTLIIRSKSKPETGEKTGDAMYEFFWRNVSAEGETPAEGIFSGVTHLFTADMGYQRLGEAVHSYQREINSRIKKHFSKEEDFLAFPAFGVLEKKCRGMVNPLLASYGYSLTNLEIRELFCMLAAFLHDGDMRCVSFAITGYERKQLHRYEVIVNRLLETLLSDVQKSARQMFAAILTVWLSEKIEITAKVNALILMHGEHSASSMAGLVNGIIGNYVYEPFDMPVEVNTDELIRKVNEYVREIDTSEGLVVLVDMGSLEKMYDKISQNIDGDLIVMNNVSSAVALEIGFRLWKKESIYRITQTDLTPFEVKMQYYKGLSQKPNIVVSCISGEGIAEEIRGILCRYVDTESIDILTMDYSELKAQLARGEENVFHNTIVVFTTTFLSSPNVTVINVEDIVNGFGIPRIPAEALAGEKLKGFTDDIVKLFTLKGVAGRLRFLNPEVIMQEVDRVIKEYEGYYRIALPNFLRINLFLHISIMIERVMLKEENMKTHDLLQNGVDEEGKEFLKVSADVFKPLMGKYKIQISDAEFLMIYQILQQVLPE